MLIKAATTYSVKTSEMGWLYMFETTKGVTSTWDSCKIKIGMTKYKLETRLKSYTNYHVFKNITAIHCSVPAKRERLLKAYLKNTLKWQAVDGIEYFDKPYEEILYYIQHFAQEDEIKISKFHNDYSKSHNAEDFFVSICKY